VSGHVTTQPSALSRFAVRFIETYRARVSRQLGTRCSFEPCCSQYALEAYQTYGFFKATRKALGRLSRCRPGYRGSRIDPLEPPGD